MPVNRHIPRGVATDWRARSRRFRAKGSEDNHPLLGLINCFDATMVLVVAMPLSLISKGNVSGMAARLSQQDVTIVTNPGKPNMEMVIKRGNKIETLKSTGEKVAGAGKRLGTAFRLENGEVV